MKPTRAILKTASLVDIVHLLRPPVSWSAPGSPRPSWRGRVVSGGLMPPSCPRRRGATFSTRDGFPPAGLPAWPGRRAGGARLCAWLCAWIRTLPCPPLASDRRASPRYDWLAGGARKVGSDYETLALAY